MSQQTILDAATTLAMNLDGIKLVEASAGTGKTYAIGNLYLRMVLAGYKVSEILVVTYTNAATEELRGRIRLRMHQALRHCHTPDTNDVFLCQWTASLSGVEKSVAERQLKLAIHSMDEAAICTIHAFCQRALNEHAFNSRQAFDVEMISDDSQIWSNALKDWWRRTTYRLDHRDLALFGSVYANVDVLIKLQQPMRRPGITLIRGEDAGDGSRTLSELFDAWHGLEDRCGELAGLWLQDRGILAAALYSDALKRAKNVYKLDNLPTLLNALDHYFSSHVLLVFPSELDAMRASELRRQLRKNKQEQGLEHPFFSMVDAVLDCVPRLKQRLKLLALQEAHNSAFEQVQTVKQQAGQLSFDDQLVMLDRALACNAVLGLSIRSRFPIAMIDEFQDTDATQYDIFSHIYRYTDYAGVQGRAGGLIMIGDPKQAIYAFRGGDIFTYIRAKQDAAIHYTLDTNWRSTPRLISAVNSLFSHREAPFIYADIPFVAVKPSPSPHALLYENGEEVTPLTIWQLPLADNGKVTAKTTANACMHAYTANEIARLILAGRNKSLLLDGKAVKPGDIAVLVRNHVEADALRDALHERGVMGVTAGSQKVLNSDEASGLKLLLTAIIDYRDASLLRQAMGSSLLSYGYRYIHDCSHDDARWQEWSELFRQLHERWQRQGFMAMFQLMLRRLAIGECMAYGPYIEQRLTNLLHLGELLQQATQSITGMDALLGWLTAQISSTENSEAEMRLESEGDLVRIVTIHASKGLEYPIVFLPYMWSCRPREKNKGLLPYYDETSQQHCLRDGLTDADLLLPEKERLAEDVRLAYVALTRACARLYLGWGRAGTSAGNTATGWLLHAVQKPDELEHTLPDIFSHGVQLEQDLQALAEHSAGNIEVIRLSANAPPPLHVSPDEFSAEASKAEIFYGRIATDWRIASFTSLTRDVHQVFSTMTGAESDDPVFNFPAGSRTGLFLHALLEDLDFQGDVKTAVAEFSRREALRYGLSSDATPLIQAWMRDVLATRLNDDEDALSLSSIAHSKRMSELSFDFSVAHLDIYLLNQTLAVAAGSPLQALTAENCRGLMNGIIDLVFEHDGRFYLADYKSNHLGYSLDAYTPKALRQVIFERRYDLQYLLYALALHRYLKLRMEVYNYDEHFGGIYYLFLRGMRPASGAGRGIFFVKPERALIEQLDEHIFKAECAA